MIKFIFFGLFLWPSLSFSKVQSMESFYQDPSENKILVFISESCPCSKSHINHLNEVATDNSDYSFYGVITDVIKSEEDKKRVKNYYKKTKFKFPILKDSKKVLVKKYKALKTPHVTLISKGEVLYQGGLTDKKSFKESGKKYLAENLKSLKETGKVKYRFGMSLGCYIRRTK